MGDNFAVKAKASNVEGIEFYVMQFVEQIHIVQEGKGLDAYGLHG